MAASPKNCPSNNLPWFISVTESPWHVLLWIQAAFPVLLPRPKPSYPALHCVPPALIYQGQAQENPLLRCKQIHEDLSLSSRVKLSAFPETKWDFLNLTLNACLRFFTSQCGGGGSWVYRAWEVTRLSRHSFPKIQGRLRKNTASDPPASDKMGMEPSKQSQCLHAAFWLCL